MKEQFRTVYIGVGSNLGNRNKNIKKALSLLKKSPNIKIIKVSSIIETIPVGFTHQPKFINSVVKIKTINSPGRLIEILKLIEVKVGRVKTFKNGPRVIDLDILLYEDLVISKANIKIPHPRMFKRDFVMKPLKELLGLKAEEKISSLRSLKPYLLCN